MTGPTAGERDPRSEVMAAIGATDETRLIYLDRLIDAGWADIRQGRIPLRVRLVAAKIGPLPTPEMMREERHRQRMVRRALERGT